MKDYEKLHNGECIHCGSSVKRLESCHGDREGIRRDYGCMNTDCRAIMYISKSGWVDNVRPPKSKATIEVSVETLRNIVKYCENMEIYDKLGRYGDFYYKLNTMVKAFDEYNEWMQDDDYK